MRVLILFFILHLFYIQKAIAAPKDSLRIETINGKKYLIYRVSANESYASLSSRYGVLETNIRQANPNHKALLRKGNIIKIPYGLNSDKIVEEQIKSESISEISEPVKPEQIIKENEIKQRKAVLYGEEIKYVLTNGKKELLYEASEDDNLDDISKYYNVLPSKIVERNNLKKTKFYEGQKLFIPVSQDVKKIENAIPIVTQNVQAIRKIDSVKTEQKAIAAKSVLSKQAEPLPTIQKATETIAVVEKPIETNIVTKKTETAKPSITKDEVKQIVSKKDVVSSAVAKKTIAVNSKKPVDEIAKDSVATVVYSHLVAQEETIEMIAKKYSVSVSDLINWNKLYQTRLRVGQDLIVNNTPKSAAKNTNSEQKDSTANQIKSLKVNKFVEHGLALLQEDNKYKGVLHRTAPVGTYIFLENAENFKKVFIRVTGNLENDNKDVILRIDDETARKVGINNPYTNVILQYSVID